MEFPAAEIRFKFAPTGSLAQVPRLDTARLFFERGDDLANSCRCLVIGLARACLAVEAGIVDDFDRMFQVVKGDQRLHEDEKNLGHAQRFTFSVRDIVQLRHRVVADVTQGAAEKGWYAGNGHRPAAGQKFFQRLQRRNTVPTPFLAVLNHFDLAAPRFKNTVRTSAQERIARPAFAAFDAFEQKGVAVALNAFEKR